MLVRELFLGRLAAAEECQAVIHRWVTEHREEWLNPRTAAALETVLVSAAFGFLIGSSAFLIWTAVTS
jgi:hypothetical protein